MSTGPSLVVFSSLFPSPARPNAGVFIRERMFRVGRTLPITVVSPRPWFPFQGLIRWFRPGYRPAAPREETALGVSVLRPAFFSVPGFARQWDGFFMALGAFATVYGLRRAGRCDVLDAHFAYPDGYAASLLGRWLRVPITITLRGTEVPHSHHAGKRRRMLAALAYAARVFSVSASLKTHMVRLGAQAAKIRVVGNGVDAGRFRPEDRVAARTQLGIPPHARVLVSVGALVPRKGFHRVIECLPRLCAHFPELVYLMIGGASPEGDMESELRALAARLDVTNRVRFLGTMAPDALKHPLSAADVFVLATANEGWANVFLEAMACGLPVVTTDVGGNREVVCRSDLGRVIPLGDRGALEQALAEALEFSWDRAAIRRYAEDNHWDQRVAVLVDEFRAIAPPRSAAVVPGHTEGA